LAGIRRSQLFDTGAESRDTSNFNSAFNGLSPLVVAAVQILKPPLSPLALSSGMQDQCHRNTIYFVKSGNGKIELLIASYVAC
jgi:hypothetical protein